jgi:hypothetical protein
MGSGDQPDRESRHGDQEAVEEIRRLFARYRQLGGHGLVSERDEPAEPSAEQRQAAAVLHATEREQS